MTERNEGFPTAIEAVFLVIALFIAQYLVGAALFDLRFLSGVEPRDVWGVVNLLGNGILFSVLLHYKKISYASLFHPSRNSVAATMGTLTVPVLLIVPGLTLAVWTVQAVLVFIFPISHWQTAMFERVMAQGPVTVVTVCILAPVLEEMLFRGIILRSFLRLYPRSHAIVGSAALFGLVHLNIYQFAVGLLLGIVSGWLYERARSLWPCILLHAAYNSVAVWIYWSFTTVEGDEQWLPTTELWIVAFVLSFAGGSLLQRLLKRGPA